MALIQCNDCGKDVSTSATACPNCGCPPRQQVHVVIATSHPKTPWQRAIKPAVATFSLISLVSISPAYNAAAEFGLFARLGLVFIISTIVGVIVALPVYAVAGLIYCARPEQSSISSDNARMEVSKENKELHPGVIAALIAVALFAIWILFTVFG